LLFHQLRRYSCLTLSQNPKARTDIDNATEKEFGILIDVID
jgi:hypothetical protein